MMPGRVMVRDYGEGYVEASWGYSSVKGGYEELEEGVNDIDESGGSYSGEREREEAKNIKEKAKRGESKNRQKNIERCEARAKSQVRRKCMAGGLDHMLTLTYRENIQEKERAYRDFELFIRHVHKSFPDWKYVVVPERQGRGAIHFHMAVKGFQDVSVLRKLWREVVVDGNIDVAYKGTYRGLTWKKARLALYLAKYIGKTEKGKQEKVETNLNERRFRASLGIAIPGESFRLFGRIMSPRQAAIFMVRSLAGNIGFIWSPEEYRNLYGWVCSWKLNGNLQT